MTREETVTPIENYFKAFEAKDFSNVKFSTRINFVSPIGEDPLVGNGNGVEISR